MINPKFEEKIRQILDFNTVEKFDLEDLELNNYVPLCLKKDILFVMTINPELSITTVNKIEKIFGDIKIEIKRTTLEQLKMTLNIVKDEVAKKEVKQDESIGQIEQKVESNQEIEIKEDSDEEAQGDAPQGDGVSPSGIDERYYNKKIGEILVQMGLVTGEQIFTAVGESRKNQVPLGTVLVQQGIISLDQLKMALTAQQGYEAVTAEQLNVSDKVISILPEDFIKLNKVIPINYDDNVLVVGMVNPNDKKVINEIIFLTGLKPSILIITHYEFSMCIQQMFSEQKRATTKILKEFIKNKNN